MKQLISLFLSHGSPMLALDNAQTHLFWKSIGERIEKPALILAVSAHNGRSIIEIDENTINPLVYDFGGFPEELYQLTYRTSGMSAVAMNLREQLQYDFPIQLTHGRGLDHGLWVPLLHIYPKGNIPVIPVSYYHDLIKTSYELAQINYHLGKKLAYFMPSNTLIMTTGSLTHNLREVFRQRPDSNEYVHEFTDWWWDKVQTNDIDSLFNYRELAPHAKRSHPSEDHILPFFIALGAAHTNTANNSQVQVSLEGHYITDYVLAMDSFFFEK